MRILAILCLALAACAPSDAKSADDYSVTLSSVNLGADCWAPPAPSQAPAKPAAPAEAAAPRKVPATPPASSVEMPADAAAPARAHPRHCDQTSMQILIKAAAGLKNAPVKVKKVELLDAKGKLIEELTARDAQKWETDKYGAWDQSVDGGKSYQVMYPLTAPSWHKVGGRMNAHEKSFQLRVTLSIGAGSHTVEKQSIVPARLPPPVPT
jgi:hypothetical protein